MFTQLAQDTAKLIHNPGIQARAILNSVYVDVTPDDERTVKITFTPGSTAGWVRVDFTLLDVRKASLDTSSGECDVTSIANATKQLHNTLFDVIELWYTPVA
ncbi:hypothetical protein [Kitasatospora sp. NPDC058478]|uniref:hypothetical protein n=1 Tax=unclassified Kitasatospora TaxID=2633591 RepID=UPI003662D0E5